MNGLPSTRAATSSNRIQSILPREAFRMEEACELARKGAGLGGGEKRAREVRQRGRRVVIEEPRAVVIRRMADLGFEGLGGLQSWGLRSPLRMAARPCASRASRRSRTPRPTRRPP